MDDLKFSIVIPAYNSEKTITKCLVSLKNLAFPLEEFEIIVVDDGSTDNTPVIAESFGAILIKKKCDSLSELRNIGAQKACGRILAFLDSDIIVDPHWLTKANEYYFVKGFDGGLHFQDDVPRDAGWIGRLWNSPARKGKNKKKETDYLVTRNLFIPKKLHEMVGGFDEELFRGKKAGEDKEYTYRIHLMGYKLILDTSLEIIHLGYEKNLLTLMRKEWWHQGNTLGMAKKHHFSFRLLRNPILSFAHLFFIMGIIFSVMMGSMFFLQLFFFLILIPSVGIIFRNIEIQYFKYIPALVLLTFVRWNIAGFALLPQMVDLVITSRKNK